MTALNITHYGYTGFVILSEDLVFQRVIMNPGQEPKYQQEGIERPSHRLSGQVEQVPSASPQPIESGVER